MIDTDKYEGHTGKEWNIKPNGWQIYAYGHIDICTMDSPYSADARLIADAPLLLAEVKRLREEKEYKFDEFEIVDVPLEWNDSRQSAIFVSEQNCWYLSLETNYVGVGNQ